MNIPKCPHCGVSVRLEQGLTLAIHPSETDCRFSGNVFSVADWMKVKPTEAQVLPPATAPLAYPELTEPEPVEPDVPEPTPAPTQDFAQTGPVAAPPAPAPQMPVVAPPPPAKPA